MGSKLPPKEMELYRRTDEVLFYIWDPIGVAMAAPARHEYQRYLPTVFALVRDRAEEQAIVDYLVRVERHMSLAPRPAEALRVARLLSDYREWIYREPPPSPFVDDSVTS